MNDSNLKDSNLENIQKKWEQKGFKSEIYTGTAGEEWSSAGHETDEIFIPLEGELEVSFGGKVYHPAVGEECLIPAKEPHSFKSKTASRYCWIAGYEFTEGVSGIKKMSSEL